MKIIFSLSHPFKITYSIIFMITIFVINMGLPFYGRQKSLRYKSMNSKCSMLTFYRQ